jgi:class 3 adenylate cyclase
MEPRVRYCTTADGARVAYTTFGQGPPLVVAAMLVGTHLQLEWEVSGRRVAYERLAESATVIRYEPRGLGMSRPGAPDVSDEAVTQDLLAVADAAGAETFSLLLVSSGSVVPHDFLRRFPERINRVACWVSARDDAQTFVARIRLLDFMMDEDWELYTEIRSRIVTGWSSPSGDALARVIRATHTPASLRLMDSVMVDQIGALGLQTTANTLILHQAGSPRGSQIAGRVAGNNPRAQIMAVPASGQLIWGGEFAIEAVREFLGQPDESAELPHIDALAAGAGVKTILFTDLVDHTQMMQRLGDDRGRAVLREHERVTREVLKEHGGTEVKTVGDSFMAWFDSAHRAIACALELQRAFAGQEIAGERLRVRAGLNAGEPVAEDGDLFGSCVILASRASAKAVAGQVLVTDVVRQLASGKGFDFREHDDAQLKGFDELVRLYEVRRRD